MRDAIRLLAPAAIAALTFVACAGTSPSQAGSPAPAAGSSAVSVKGFTFSPTTVTVAKGTKVTFSNGDGTTHTVTSGANGAKDGKFDQEVAAGKDATITFDTAGTFDYFCRIHSSMKAKITVQ